MSTLSTHILDISTGRPAQGVKIALEREGALVARGVTDDNGRIGELGAGTLAPGRYRLCAEIGEWFAASGRETLREAAGEHYHLPFLISPGGWSTYRGS